MEKLSWCDYLVFICPMHWFSLPAMLKGWIDKVFASSFAYSGGKWYDNGNFRGKKALLTVTTGAPEFMYRSDGINGEINSILFPTTHGLFYFCGMTAIESFIVYSPSHGTQEYRESELKRYANLISTIDTAPTLHFRKMKDCNFDAKVPPESSIPVNAPSMITTTNAMLRGNAFDT